MESAVTFGGVTWSGPVFFWSAAGSISLKFWAAQVVLLARTRLRGFGCLGRHEALCRGDGQCAYRRTGGLQRADGLYFPHGKSLAI